MRAKGYKCNNVKCDRCVGHSMCGELGDAAMNCVDRIITRQTNADRIRDMSDEELALFVRAIITAESCPYIDCDCDECFFKEPCSNGLKWYGKEMEWLQQPAE